MRSPYTAEAPYSANAVVKLELVLRFIPIQQSTAVQDENSVYFSQLLCFNSFNSAGGKIAYVTHVISNVDQLP